MRNTVLIIFGLIGLVILLVNLTPVQNFIAQRTTHWLSQKLKTNVAIKHIRIDFRNHLSLEGLFIEDQAHDTLLYAGVATVRLSDWFIFNDKPVLRYLSLENSYVHQYRTRASNKWNSDFIEQAFSTGASPKNDTTKSKPFEFGLEKIEFSNVRIHLDDAWGGQDLDFDIGKLALDANALDFKRKLIDINNIAIRNLLVVDNEYKGGKPPRDKSHDTVDTSPFNEDKWEIRVHKLSLDSCGYNLTMDDKVPLPHLFDENHLRIKNITTSIKDISIIGDTIRGQTLSLHAEERCGIVIKNLTSKISVSPVASICADLNLELNHSKINNYYAMHYKRFPAFLDYIDSVEMVGRLDNATIDTRDIEFFAPEMKYIPAVVKLTGEGRGTVANLNAKHITMSDGNSVVKGNLTMKGLPDIYKTYITYTDGEIYTNGAAAFKYAEGLKNSPDINLEALTHVYFKGQYKGYIDNFAVQGAVTTNLGNLTADVKMGLPGFKSSLATYTGAVTTDNLHLGILFRQPYLGALTCNEKVTGNSFDLENVVVALDGNIKELGINNYNYHNIETNGTLSKKKFIGKLLVDDPNLALEFDGGLDYNDMKNIRFNTTAHLLYSNLKALNITADSVTTSADFDLNCTGSNIDNFLGYARLYNIDLKRGKHKVAIDSIFMSSDIAANGKKELSVLSNVLTASISGQYQLSKLPASVQYYLSKYIPNYIKPPLTFAPDQNIEFAIKTRDIDSVLAVTFPWIKGFGGASLTGSFNTTAQKLILNANVPYGTMDRFHMRNIGITAEGNLDHVALSTTIDNVAVGDSLINSSLSLTTTLANDSLNFTVATTSPDTASSITLKGQILARTDSLFLSIFPSQFFLNRTKWDIAGGSTVTYSKNFLDVENIFLSSGLQKVMVNTMAQGNEQQLIVGTEALDIAQLGYWAGISGYQPDGRLNGTIIVDKIFSHVSVSASMKATDVKFGGDTIGTVNVVGSYDGSKGLLNFDPQTGIYRDDASIVASGNISFDSTTSIKLDGDIIFNKARVAWASPFLIGIFSHLSGIVNGSVKFRGTSDEPVISGTLGLLNAGLHVDYMGCNYTIPEAEVKVTNKRISWDKTTIFDSYNNTGTVAGYFSHNHFADMNMHITLASPKMEVMKLTASDNNLFYGSLIASMDSFTVRGPFNFIKLHGYNVAPADRSHIFIPLSTGGDISTYSYVTFKNYGKSQEKPKHVAPYKMDINIDANFNNLAEMTIVLDPSTGDAITARGDGNVQLSIPPSTDMRINGIYRINEGTYNFTFKKLEYHREFVLNEGGVINFVGPFSATTLDVNATYSHKARLYDLLTESEIASVALHDKNELAEDKRPMTVNILMNMRGRIFNPTLTFNIDLPDKERLLGNYAVTKLMMNINQDDRQKTEQVGSFLLINAFIPSDGFGSVAGNVAVNNISQLVSGQASQGITNLVNKLLKDDKLNIDLNYNNYNYNDLTLGTNGNFNRNQVKVGVSHPFLNDKLIVEVGSTSDWGRPVSQTAANSVANSFNITGDFRVQYILKQGTGLRLNAFRTSDYDVTLDKNIARGGVGISWRKSFDNLTEFFSSSRRYAERQKEFIKKQKFMEDSGATKPVGTQ